MRQDLCNVVDRVMEAEGRVSELEDALMEQGNTLQKLTTGALKARAEDAENHTRRNNLCLCWIS